MKQIIVNVGDLTIEEKWRVGEALALIKNIKLDNPTNLDTFDTAYGPSSNGTTVGFGYFKHQSPTHTPQQVLAMAGMEPVADQYVILADTLIITDSSGNIIYDSTLGDSVKLDKNGAAVMVEKRKVRKDFDAGKEYSVNVFGCSEVEKKEVQQAFFDAGFPWRLGGKEYRCLNAVQYSNALVGRGGTAHLLYSDTTTEGCNLTSKEFLDLVYEPEQVGHVHAELMAQYAEDAKTTDKPWDLYQIKTVLNTWKDIGCQFIFDSNCTYRRKPKTKLVHGVEVPDFSFAPAYLQNYWVPDPSTDGFCHQTRYAPMSSGDIHRVENGLCYPLTDEGREAAILHAKAMLGDQS